MKSIFISTLIKSLVFVIFVVFLCGAKISHAEILAGKYKSLDGKFEHNFMASGDYKGSWTGIHETGLYKQGAGVCRNNNGAAGNLVLFYGTYQCCLLFQPIAGKWAVTAIYTPNQFGGFGICQNQVLSKVDN